jgi:hypothetical protein
VSGRLDDEKLETLRSWGAGLAGDGRDELRAAGKAILILVDEIERLQVDVWHARRGGPADASGPEASEGPTEADDVEDDDHTLDSTLRGRVRRLLTGG